MKEIEMGNVARYCKPSTLDEYGNPQGSSFKLRPNRNEKGLSVYLLEFFGRNIEKENVSEVKKEMERKNFSLKKSGVFATLNIQDSKSYIFELISEQISYREMNLPHCGIFHENDDGVISDLLAKCVQSHYSVNDL